MSELFKKLNYKNQSLVLVANAPPTLVDDLAALRQETEVQTSVSAVTSTTFALFFTNKQAELEALARQIAAKLDGDGIFWIAYPKGSSKNYTCDFNRDTGWGVLGELGFEPVRQVAIDADWSALRFRKVGYIKKITRREHFALTKEGKERTTHKKEE